MELAWSHHVGARRAVCDANAVRLHARLCVPSALAPNNALGLHRGGARRGLRESGRAVSADPVAVHSPPNVCGARCSHMCSLALLSMSRPPPFYLHPHSTCSLLALYPYPAPLSPATLMLRRASAHDELLTKLGDRRAIKKAVVKMRHNHSNSHVRVDGERETKRGARVVKEGMGRGEKEGMKNRGEREREGEGEGWRGLAPG